MILRITFIFLLVSITMHSYGQVAEEIFDSSWQEQFFENSEVVVPRLMEQAIRVAPELEANRAQKEIAVENRKITKKEIISGFNLGGGYTYGTMLNFRDFDPQGGGNPNPFAQPAMGMYNVGFQVRLPLGDLLSRKNQINIQTMNLKAAEADGKLQTRMIREQVILLYQEIVIAKSELELREEALQSANIHYQMAEKQLHDGEILITDMARINEIYSAAAIGHSTAKVRYETSFMMLEEIIDMRIVDLMNLSE